MIQIIFLYLLALVWIVFATVQDWKTREIADWLNFSLIIFALGFRFFYSLFVDTGFTFFYQGLIGLVIFFVIGNALYYSRFFAGGDAKLMIALGAVLPFSYGFFNNLQIYMWFLVIFFLAAAVYSIGSSIWLSLVNFKRFKMMFKKLWKGNKKFSNGVMILGLLVLILGFTEVLIFYLGILIFFSPLIYIYVKSVDESCMIRKVVVGKLCIGDWLYNDIKVGTKVVKANWDGLIQKEINLIKKKHKSVLIRQGIPFTPVFLISFLIMGIFLLTKFPSLFQFF